MPDDSDGNIPYATSTVELYQERAEASIAYQAALAERCDVRARLLLAHAAQPSDLRDAQIRLSPEYREVIERQHRAFARRERVEAMIDGMLADRALRASEQRTTVETLQALAVDTAASVSAMSGLVREATERANNR